MVPLLPLFCKRLKITDVIYSLTVLIELIIRPSRYDFLGGLLIMNSILKTDIELFRLSICPIWVLVLRVFIWSSPFHLCYQICGKRVVYNLLLISVSSVVTISPSFLILIISVFLWLSWLKIYQFYWFLQRINFWLNFFSLLFITSFISDLIFIIYFLVLTLGFNYFYFSSFLNWKLSKTFFPINTYAFNAEYFTLIFVFAALHKFG